MQTKYLAVILAVMGALSVLYTQNEAKPQLSAFEKWKVQNGVSYDSMFEEAYRERVFLQNLEAIETHNSESNSYKKGVNQFTGMTQEEFAATYLGLVAPEQYKIDIKEEQIVAGDIEWTDCVTPVKNQGQCGSCWAFSATGNLEALNFQTTGTLVGFSEQQLVDCSSSYGNYGCNGGLMDNAFNYVKDHGIVTQDKYPYKAVQQACAINQGPFKVSGFANFRNCNDLANALQKTPVSVAVDASNWSSYHSGVFSNCATRLNHGVLLIGIKGGQWHIKNSWGTSWGESGHIRLAEGNTCGVCSMASIANK